MIRMIVAMFISLGAMESAQDVKTNLPTNTLNRSDGSQLTYYFVPPHQKSFPIMLYLDGSSCKSATQILPYFKPFVDMGFGMLTLEKRGVTPGTSNDACSKEYLETNDRNQRVDDTKLLLSNARNSFPGWDGRLVVMGASEGGTIAPEVALSYDGTIAVVSLTGGGLSQSEEIKILKKKELTASGATPEAIKTALAQLDDKFEEIRKSPVSSKSWLGEENTYKRWASYLWYSPLVFFVKLPVPIYIAQGTLDKNAPIESSDAIQDRFKSLRKTNLTYRRYDGLDHEWIDSMGTNQTQKIIGDLIDWLSQTVRQI